MNRYVKVGGVGTPALSPAAQRGASAAGHSAVSLPSRTVAVPCCGGIGANERGFVVRGGLRLHVTHENDLQDHIGVPLSPRLVCMHVPNRKDSPWNS